MTTLSNPLLLGFEEIERLIDRAAKGGDGYPPYNIERIATDGDAAGLLRITLAVAGFSRDDLEITLEDKQLTIRGKQQDDKSRDYVYRGIASRQFFWRSTCNGLNPSDSLSVLRLEPRPGSKAAVRESFTSQPPRPNRRRIGVHEQPADAERFESRMQDLSPASTHGGRAS
jgi:hypothetical protein